MKKRQKKIFCGGICKIWERIKRKCNTCNVYLCGVCEFIYHEKVYCINCFLKDFDIKQDLKKEFGIMVKDLDNKKKESIIFVKT